MKKLFLIITLFFTTLLLAQNPILGKWKTVDDETGKALSVIDIYEKGGKIYGRVHDILEPKNKKRVCEKCSGDEKDKPILGMILIKGLTKDGDEYNGGKILDPKTGKLYKCYINLEEKDKLKVRGYIGIALLGRTQYWYRTK